MNNLAKAYELAGNLEQALPLLEETLKVRKANLSLDHPDTLMGMNNLASGYWRARKLDKSIPLLEEALALQEKKLGRSHPSTQVTVANLGVNFKDAGRIGEAIPLLEEAHQASRKFPKLRWVAKQLLDGYAKAGKEVEAAAMVEKRVARARRSLPRDSPQLADALFAHALQLVQVSAYPKAEQLLRECLTIRQRTQPEHWTTFSTQATLGRALLGQKKYSEAEPLLLAGYEGMKKHEEAIPPNRKALLTEAIDELIALYTALEEPKEREKWQAIRENHAPPQ